MFPKCRVDANHPDDSFFELLAYRRLRLREQTLLAARKILTGPITNVWHFRWAISLVTNLDGKNSDWRKLARATFRRMTPLHRAVTKVEFREFLSTKAPQKPRIRRKRRIPYRSFRECPDDFKDTWSWLLMQEQIARGNRRAAARLASQVQKYQAKCKDVNARNTFHVVLANYYELCGKFRNAERHWRSLNPHASFGDERFENLCRLQIRKAFDSASQERAIIQSHLAALRERNGPRNRIDDFEVSVKVLDYYCSQLHSLCAKPGEFF